VSNSPDFHSYSYGELLEAYRGVDEQKFPERKAQILALLQDRKDSDEAQQLQVVDKYATFWPRFFASLVDGTVISTALQVLAWLMSGTAVGSVKFLLLQFISTFLYLGYSIAMHSTSGATLGKSVFNLQVVQVNGEGPIGWKEGLARDSVPLVITTLLYLLSFAHITVSGPLYFIVLLMGSITLVWWLAEMVTMLFHPKRRALHDLLADTVVIRQ